MGLNLSAYARTANGKSFILVSLSSRKKDPGFLKSAVRM